uniref:Uncharacterized protein n=1 Tax=Pararge aegeria TaxID=116150 RepID=S4NW84_9NEOP
MQLFERCSRQSRHSVHLSVYYSCPGVYQRFSGPFLSSALQPFHTGLQTVREIQEILHFVIHETCSGLQKPCAIETGRRRLVYAIQSVNGGHNCRRCEN